MKNTLEAKIEKVWYCENVHQLPIQQWAHEWAEDNFLRSSPAEWMDAAYFQMIYDTESLIKENIAEALTSPVVYVRKYAELLYQKQNIA